MRTPKFVSITKEPIIDQTYSFKISPNPSLPKRGIPPFCNGREGGIYSSVSAWSLQLSLLQRIIGLEPS